MRNQILDILDQKSETILLRFPIFFFIQTMYDIEQGFKFESLDVQ